MLFLGEIELEDDLLVVDDLKSWGEMIFGVKVANCIGQVQRFFTGFGNKSRI
jgi:hypothetical protein